MATMTHQPTVNSKYFLNNRTEPSPPEAYLYGQGAYASPMSSPPSASISPTNIHSPYVNVRQLRQPRQPMYIPAALRPTDPPSRPTDVPIGPRALLTPPTSKDSSFDSAKSKAGVSTREVARIIVDSPVDVGDVDLLRQGLSRAASEGLDDEPGEVTGPPTTAHWKPDVSANDCAVCHQTFTWYFRRHHCRRCGDIVCDTHIAKKVPLDQNARYHPDGTESKACDPCWQEWCVVKRIRHSRNSSMANSISSSQGTALPALEIPKSARSQDDVRVGSMARSEGMVWSTF
ncbi:hypothetical protein BAUCODRAFT_38066 [Baudoinia panamericana UAMH 10762]|uniref:FYVE-type domain-containing protein n=1 Tax=Baudoinia panamericana (strain UAMH 10762) TaxID=717646 RepID=M2LDJ8_BAUPA|nr:uncharacterized protein BAUCODRAFT_38066 [Baudoinia panamericana UAMH 10762]EMC92047.1 hypothetical protein BAUCODRAFT_38066 [Baudoinia panamericana UAMH 10762]